MFKLLTEIWQKCLPLDFYCEPPSLLQSKNVCSSFLFSFPQMGLNWRFFSSMHLYQYEFSRWAIFLRWPPWGALIVCDAIQTELPPPSLCPPWRLCNCLRVQFSCCYIITSDSYWSWGMWSGCDTTCGPGRQVSVGECVKSADHCMDCPGTGQKERECNNSVCCKSESNAPSFLFLCHILNWLSHLQSINQLSNLYST